MKAALLVLLYLLTTKIFAFEYIAKLKLPNALPQKISKEINSITRLNTKTIPNLYAIRSNKDIFSTLKQSKEIIHVERNIPIHISSRPPQLVNDPYFNYQWALFNTQSYEGHFPVDLSTQKAWEITRGNRDITIAILDTGIDFRHIDLQGQIFTNQPEKDGVPGVDDDNNGYIDDVYGYDFVNRHGDGFDDNGHGTHCAGIIGALADNGIGVAGVMPEVQLLPIKFLDKNGGGGLTHVLEAIDYAILMKVNIMSNSWAAEDESEFLKEYIKKAGDAGIVFVVAAGNYGTDIDENEIYPAIYSQELDNVITVASHDQHGALASYSDYGIKSVQIAAPGDQIISTIPNDRFEMDSGTSMATPYVAGAIGLLLSVEPWLSPGKIKDRLTRSSIPSRKLKEIYNQGRLNLLTLLTDKRWPRAIEGSWKRYILPNPFESAHPYQHGLFTNQTFTIPGARFIRAVISRYDLDKNFDFLKISVPGTSIHREVIEEITGEGEEYTTEYLDGDTINILFESRYVSDGNWGFSISQLEYIPL